MEWKKLLGQDAAVAALRLDLESGRLGGAYIFYGPEGVGKAAAAELFAQSLECEAAERPCGLCLPCRKVARGVHPDVIRIRPAEGKKSVGVEEARESILARAYQRPQEGRAQVFLLDDAHRFTVNTFNALLKTLEEPPENTFFILITPNLHILPPTVISRCRRIRFAALSREQMREILIARGGGELDDPDALIGMSLGRLGVALGGAPDQLQSRRETALKMLEGLSAPPGQADEIALLALAADQASGGGSAREAVTANLEMLRGLLRDILVLQVAPGEVVPWNTDVADELATLGERWGTPGLIRALERVETAYRDVAVGNTNPGLTLEALVIALRATIGAGGRG
ncbi:MAG: DNA polymerase III subunit [bacterium]|nr:DNA polymerase III subunit [bacterium]